jgi:hypothetical protein
LQKYVHGVVHDTYQRMGEIAGTLRAQSNMHAQYINASAGRIALLQKNIKKLSEDVKRVEGENTSLKNAVIAALGIIKKDMKAMDTKIDAITTTATVGSKRKRDGVVEDEALLLLALATDDSPDSGPCTLPNPGPPCTLPGPACPDSGPCTLPTLRSCPDEVCKCGAICKYDRCFHGTRYLRGFLQDGSHIVCCSAGGSCDA